MSEVSVQFNEAEIVFAVDGEVAGRLLNSNCHPEGLAEFKRTNYDLQGSVVYQPFLRGTVAGLVLAFGPYGHRPDAEESTAKVLQPSEPSEVGTVDSVLPDPELVSGELVSGIVSGELVAGIVEETTAEPVSGDTPVADTRGLTPPGSPEETPEAPAAS